VEHRRLERAVEGRYRLQGRIARTTMAAVFLGWESGLERRVAIKLLAAERCRDADDRGRFRREARILAGLAHPNIVSVLAFGEQEGACWFAMPYLPGGTLSERLERERRLSVEDTREILWQLADALAYAHGRGIVHRDVKAENVMFDESGRPVLTDFGVATLRTSDHSRAEASKGYGTAHYMPPEQVLGAPDADGRADLYALGVLGFRMLAGRFPFEGTDQQITAQHLSCDVPPVSAYAAGLPGELTQAIDRCLRKRPQDRWSGAAELRDALRERPAIRVGLLRRLVGRS
jgi:serine/threonine-protein kinase